jgi:aryl-alcohol dehydrogenase-like predicted oxidoreductase
MNPTCKMLGVSTIPWSPVARGLLTRPVSGTSSRLEKDPWMAQMKEGFEESSNEIIRRVEKVANEKGVTMAQVATAWLLHQDVVAAPVIGVQKIERISDLISKQSLVLCTPSSYTFGYTGAVHLKLTREELKYLEEPYIPRSIMGH